MFITPATKAFSGYYAPCLIHHFPPILITPPFHPFAAGINCCRSQYQAWSSFGCREAYHLASFGKIHTFHTHPFSLC